MEIQCDYIITISFRSFFDLCRGGQGSGPTAIFFSMLYIIEIAETKKISEAQGSGYLFLRMDGVVGVKRE